MSESNNKNRKRLRALQKNIDRAQERIEVCRARREKVTDARERALASEDLRSAHRHIQKLKPLFADERAASEAYSEALDALSRALEEIERRVRARTRRRRK